MTHLLRLLGLLLLITISNRTAISQDADAALKNVFNAYHEQFLILFPIEATQFGDGRYNDQLPIDISSEFRAKEKQFYEETLQRLMQVDRQQASQVNRLAADILEYELNMRLEAPTFNFDRIPFNQFNGLPLMFAQLGSGASSQPFKSIADYDNWLKRVDAFTIWSRVAIDRFREGMRDDYVLPAVLVQRMIAQCLDPTIVSATPEESIFYGPIDKMPDRFSETDRVELTARYKSAISDKIIPAYRALGKFLQEEYLPAARATTGIGDLPQGADQYKYWVRRWTTTDLTPDQIFEMGQVEVQRITEEMEQVRTQMKFDGTLNEFFEYLRTDPQFKPFDTADEVLAFFRGIKERLEPQLADLFLRSPKTPFEIRRTEAFREKTASAEYMPGAADGSRPGIFYCPIPDAEEFNITSGLESLFLHEALPGHHYQVSLQQENEALPTFARFLWYGAYGEGWALYCESIGAELGMYSDPRQKIGALGDEMHRAIRLVVDVGMHEKGWTREQAIEYMMSKEPISEPAAVAEIERYMAYPGQALSYKIGQLKISQLRRKQEEELGDQFSIAEFHDAVLRNGCMPLSVLERQFAD